MQKVEVLGGADGSLGNLLQEGEGIEEFEANATGDALVVVSANCTGAIYSLGVHSSTDDGLLHDPITLEPNDTPSIASLIEVGQSINSSVRDPFDTADRFRVDLVADRYYTLDSICSSCVHLDLEIGGGKLGDRGKLLENPVFGGTDEFVALETGPALITLEFSAGGEQVYEFTLLPSTDDGLLHDFVTLEPNNSPSTACKVDVGQLIDASISHHDETDYYRMDIGEVRAYSLTMLKLGDCKNYRIFVKGGKYGERKELLNEYGDGTYSFTPVEVGPVLITVRDEGCGSEARYSLQVQ